MKARYACFQPSQIVRSKSLNLRTPRAGFVRINEVTQGENGRAAMMADLPPRTLYTYAVEFSVEEAIEKNAEKVVFEEPVFMYVDNFLDFPAGTIVPSGFYDRNTIAWEAMPDGLVLKVTDIKNGIAVLEFSNGLPEIERREIAKHDKIGDSFWRVPTKHFSPFDLNWGGPYPPGTQPSPLPGDGFAPDSSMGQEPGSIIGCPTQTLGEQVPLNGTPFVLSYRTSLKTYEVNTGHVIWSFEYDAAGRLIGLIDRDGDKTTVTHDGDGNPTSIVGPNGVTWTFKTKEKMLQQIISPENETYTFDYSDEGLMRSMQTPRGPGPTFEQSEFIYDAAGRLTTDIQPNGGVSTLEKNSSASAVTFKSAEGRQTRYGFSGPTSRNHSSSRRTGDLSSRSYTADGWTFSSDQSGIKQRSRNVSHPIFGPISSFADTSIIDLPSGLTGTRTTELSATLANAKLRDGLQNWTLISKNMDRVTTTTWDRTDSILSTKTGGARLASVKLDEKARPVLLSSPGLSDTKLEYDIQGRPSKIIRDTREISFQYNTQGYTESVTAADGTVKYSRDKMGRVLTLERKDATTAGFTYDPWGYLTSITPPGAGPYTMAYDIRGNMTFMNSPNATRTEYEYDLDHRPIKMTQGDGRDVKLSYDESNRVKEINADGSMYLIIT